MRERRVVLWGGRRGDVQFGSTAWRRSRIPIGQPTIMVSSSSFADVWSLLEVAGQAVAARDVVVFRVVGMEGNVLGVEPL